MTNTELIWHLYERVLPDAFSLLPGQMDSREARAMLIAIGLQESDFNARRQGGRGTAPGFGPARGFWQFEKMGGVAEILHNTTTGPIIKPICEMLLYDPTPATCHAAIEHNDVLATCFARLLLWVDPRALPSPIEVNKGWRIYNANWRPGKPHPEKWPECFAEGWRIVQGR
jgi:hypothetical protein